MRQCSSNFKEKRRYIKNNRERGRGRGKQGAVGVKNKENQETMSTFISRVIPHQWWRAVILIKTKSIHRYRHAGSELPCLKRSVAIKDK